ncbi:serine/threonine-protein kinase [Kitasatospora nipponensis]|uniref:non-specific serine/threonine protein kinase n=1 Tax=Kitasatospora nipponensis TaxID=258049 RepID=A0ABN1WB81_9ACTN
MEAHPGAGRLVGGRYRLLERLGFGGMGTVWRAHDEVVDRDVAVKEPRLPTELSAAERTTAHLRMQREARAAARVDHPSVVTVHDVVTVDDSPWIVMELVRGRSLAEVLQEGTLPPREAARIGLAVLEALAAAHEAGVLHRDVKPANILLGRHGRVVLTDFGIAKVEGEQKLTETGTFIGSPEFLSPERVLGQGPGPASDLWSLGVVLFQAVEGVSPFRRQTTASTLQAILLAELPRPANAGELADLLARLLRKEPQTRPVAAALIPALRAFAEPPPRAPAASAADPGPVGAAGAGAVGGTAGGGPLPRRVLRAVRTSRRAQLATGTGVLAISTALLWALLSPPAADLPAGWRTFEEKEVDATLAAPGGYLRSVDDSVVTFSDPTKVFVIKLTKWTGESKSSLGVGNADLAWFRENQSHGSDDRADGAVTATQQQGKNAALLDVHYTDTTDYANPKAQRTLELALVRKDGAGYKLELAMPAATEQAAEGQRIFADLRAHLQIHGL